jgi:O-acetyl-ADP-ribose deacetylase (regulator of RNase III)
VRTEVFVMDDDIARVPADALITAINSGGAWFGGIDGVIIRNAGNIFHQQAAANMPLHHGQTINARHGNHAHSGAFKNVVFVVDDLEGPLSDIIYNGLKAAFNAGYKTVSLPTIRMGVMIGQVEKTADEAMVQIAEGVRRFLEKSPTGFERITFVVYKSPELQQKLENALTK